MGALDTSRPIFKLLEITDLHEKKIGKAFITHHTSFELINTEHCYYFVVGVWLLNFSSGLRNFLATLSLKIEYL